jgi:hypothetical protein
VLRIRIEVKSRIRIHNKVKGRTLIRINVMPVRNIDAEAHPRAAEAHTEVMEAHCGVVEAHNRASVKDLHRFDEDPDPHKKSESGSTPT